MEEQVLNNGVNVDLNEEIINEAPQNGKSKKSKKSKRTQTSLLDRISKISITVIFELQVLILMIPVFWMLVTAFRDPIDYYTNEFAMPSPWVLENFKTVLPLLKVEVYKAGLGLIRYSAVQMVGYSFIWAFGAAIVMQFWYMLCGYVFAKYNFRGKNFLYGVGIFVMIAPIVGGLTSGMVMYKRLGVYDNMLVQILLGPGCSFSGGTFLIYYAMFRGVPWDYAEAAMIDGAGHVRVFLQIMFPHIAGFFLVQFLLGFMGQWNNYDQFLVMLPSYANLAYGMYLFQMDAATYGATQPQVMAGFLYVSLPSVIIYLCFQKIIMTKANASGLKG